MLQAQLADTRRFLSSYADRYRDLPEFLECEQKQQAAEQEREQELAAKAYAAYRRLRSAAIRWEVQQKLKSPEKEGIPGSIEAQLRQRLRDLYEQKDPNQVDVHLDGVLQWQTSSGRLFWSGCSVEIFWKRLHDDTLIMGRQGAIGAQLLWLLDRVTHTEQGYVLCTQPGLSLHYAVHDYYPELDRFFRKPESYRAKNLQEARRLVQVLQQTPAGTSSLLVPDLLAALNKDIKLVDNCAAITVATSGVPVPEQRRVWNLLTIAGFSIGTKLAGMFSVWLFLTAN